MNTIPAQEIKRRGISAVDEALRDGPVHIIKNNRPHCVVLTEEQFQELLEARQAMARESLRASLEDLQAGRVKRYDNVDSLMQQLEHDDGE
ncbi:MAG TPA: type II toxin-antitoxin system Phd/YefM family antitoxin [Candidatus Competibacteraceae bacterium]|nr:MAG: type II toxin-antitoxin system Phd/YefM family antitoxin [Candidatus Competibacteraceae bacterium]HOB63345.1 type II toxin-antitoxin system Phd/YefM family antitoxin [Candidatus Competibacteraceae bacterium]HQA27236.1 type II toxin-antitoxin system Phd/YefM family antitoxin [Candidatus Competibacteraceae bacterium]HQD57901.1 type II toxin-antitoxin system Phd/YefM family antitoxin [Candidatus Competibacteraceae bacterium]